MRVFLFILSLLMIGGTASANCSGQDLRPTLEDQERQHLQNTVDETPYAEGNHWVTTRGAETIHLIGSIHVDHPGLQDHVKRLSPVVATSAIAFFEMTLDDRREMEKEFRDNPDLLIMSDATLPEMMDEQTWTMLANAAQKRGYPPFMTAKFRPWYLTMMLAMPPCMSLDNALAGGLDNRLQDVAYSAGRTVRALEDYHTVMDFFNNAPFDQQMDMLLAAIFDPILTEDMYATMFKQFFEEKHAEAWELSRLLTKRSAAQDPERIEAAFRNMEDFLLDSRNQRWVKTIADAAKGSTPDTPVAVIAGAAHLSGEQGLLALLAERGFLLERRPF